MKIDNRFVFPIRVLRDYVKNNWRNSKTQYEILAALTVLKIFEDEKPGEYFIYFPLRPSHEKRFPTDKKIFFLEDFFRLFHDGNAPEDIFLLRKEEGYYAVIPLQIKRYGVGKWKTGSTNELMSFLEDKKRFAANDTQLIIVFEDIPVTPDVPKDLSNASQWLKQNGFPFKGVIAVHPFASGEMLFWQLKPSKDEPAVKKFSKEQILS